MFAITMLILGWNVLIGANVTATQENAYVGHRSKAWLVNACDVLMIATIEAFVCQ